MCNLLLSMMIVGAYQSGPNQLTVQIMDPNYDIHECLVIPAPVEEVEGGITL